MGFDFLKWFIEQDERKYAVIILLVLSVGIGYIGYDLYQKNIVLSDEKTKVVKDCESDKMEMSKEFRGFMNSVIIEQNKRISIMDSQRNMIMQQNIRVERIKNNLNDLKDEVSN